MGHSTSRNLDVFRFSVEGNLTANTVDELKEAILPIIASVQEIEVDMSQISEIDHSGLLLMVSVKLEAAAQDTRLWFVECSPPVVCMMNAWNMRRFFDDTDWAARKCGNRSCRH